ncbi:MAG TPA: tripeptide aminopeptidase PepT, partial [Limnochordales bacterium]
MTGLSREALLHEGVLAKFLRYVQVDSPSSESSPSVPSTPQQWEMARLLAGELAALGLPEVELTDHGIVLGLLPGDAPATVGLLAHYDTFPGVPGVGVRPLVHRCYDGRPLPLPAGPVLDPAEQPALREAVGLDLVTSDGSTLLGADDKAGVAEIMEALCRLLRHPYRPRPSVRVAFTPDEETGRGIAHLDLERFRCDAAYTVDGSGPGELSGENFDALNVVVTLQGRSAHTGSARGRMVNALHMAAELLCSIPATMRPETTDGYEGFLHPDRLEGSVESCRVRLLLRDFTPEGLQRRRALLEQLLVSLRQRYPGSETQLEVVGGY